MNSTCEFHRWAISSNVTNPYAPHVRSVYLFGQSPRTARAFAQRAKAVEDWRQQLQANNTVRSQLNMILRTGVQLNEIGVHLAPMHLASQRASARASSLREAANTVVHNLMLLGRSNMARVVWKCDHDTTRPIWSRRCDHDDQAHAVKSAGRKMLDDLRVKGLTLVRNFGLDTAALRAQAEQLFFPSDPSSGGGLYHQSLAELIANRLPALLPLLEDATLAHTMRSYLGGNVRLDGLNHADLRANVNRRNYDSALWHHDRCGSRLKLFIYTQDVPRNAHPTQVASGSHTNLWYLYDFDGAADTSRVTEKYVAAHYSIQTLDAPAGGGFIFDTNSLHRADPDGNASRPGVIQLEFHAHGKVPAMQREGAYAPCPSYPPRKTSGHVGAHYGPSQAFWGHDARMRGHPGWRLYPQEDKQSFDSG